MMDAKEVKFIFVCPYKNMEAIGGTGDSLTGLLTAYAALDSKQ